MRKLDPKQRACKLVLGASALLAVQFPFQQDTNTPLTVCNDCSDLNGSAHKLAAVGQMAAWRSVGRWGQGKAFNASLTFERKGGKKSPPSGQLAFYRGLLLTTAYSWRAAGSGSVPRGSRISYCW